MKPARKREREAEERAARILELLRGYAEGVHELRRGAIVLDSELPVGLAAVYRLFNGGSFFHDTLRLVPATELRAEGGRWRLGELAGDELWIDRGGDVWRCEEDSGEFLEEGSSFDRWLAGYIDAEAVLYDREGEFVDGVFDEEGELLPETRIARERAALRRDSRAVAPRWRLARALAAAASLADARRLLEELLEDRPAFGWAWFDMARVSEALGELGCAREEAEAAADANIDYEHAGFFLAHAARLALQEGDEGERARLAARALSHQPGALGQHVEGARQLLAEGDREAAAELLAVAAALAPRDLSVLDLRAQLAGPLTG